MCCDPSNDFSYKDVDGECSDCGSNTVRGEAIDACNWSSVICEICGYAPCDESC